MEGERGEREGRGESERERGREAERQRGREGERERGRGGARGWREEGVTRADVTARAHMPDVAVAILGTSVAYKRGA